MFYSAEEISVVVPTDANEMRVVGNETIDRNKEVFFGAFFQEIHENSD